MSGTPVSRITHYRGRSDTGAIDASPTFIAAEDTPFSVTIGTAFRIRIGVENTGTGTDTITAPDTTRGIQRCGQPAAAFSSLANVINGADAGSSADAANVATQRLTNGTGTFETGVAGYDENESLSTTSTNGRFTEVEFGVVLTGGASTVGVGGGESWTFEVGGLTNASANVPTFTTPDTNGTNFQHGNQLGGAGQSVANSATISMTTGADIRANNLVVVCVSCDNNGTTDADLSEVSGVTCGGVAMAKAKEFTFGSPGAQASATVSMWWLQHSSQINSGSTITATFTTATTSGDANCIQAREFVVAASKTVAVEATNSTGVTAAQVASIDATTSNIECLRIAAYAYESPVGTRANDILFSSSDWSGWWTSALLSVSTGSGVSGMNLIVEGNISTGTGKAARLGATASTRDFAQVYVAFRADAAAGGGQPIVARAGGVDFMHSIGRMAQNIKVWFQGLFPDLGMA